MAELLIKINGNATFDAGDIIAIKEDGAVWGNAEKDTSIFKIVTLPGPSSKYDYLLDQLDADIRDILPDTILYNPKLFANFINDKQRIDKHMLKQKRYKIENNQIIDKTRK